MPSCVWQYIVNSTCFPQTVYKINCSCITKVFHWFAAYFGRSIHLGKINYRMTVEALVSSVWLAHPPIQHALGEQVIFFGDCLGYHCCFHCLLRGLWNMTGQPETPKRIVVFVFLWRWDGSRLWDAEWSETTWWSAMFLPEARREDNDQEIWAYRYVCEYTTHTHTHVNIYIHINIHINTYRY